jgi:hypothetical protein
MAVILAAGDIQIISNECLNQSQPPASLSITAFSPSKALHTET